MADHPLGVREFRAGTAREALTAIRRTLGAEAIILDQRADGAGIVIKACAEMQQAEAPTPREAPTADVAQLIVPEPPGGSRLVFADQPIATLRGRYRFVGSSGIGKTSLIIKIAAEWVLHNPADQLVIVTTDHERLAGTESLHLAAQLLGVRLIEPAVHELDSTLQRLAHGRLVLIDAPALSSRAAFPVNGAMDLLVVSAVHQPAVLERQFACLAGLPLQGVCITHADERAGAEAVLFAVERWGLPIYWLSAGGALPGGLDAASAETCAVLIGGTSDGATETRGTAQATGNIELTV